MVRTTFSPSLRSIHRADQRDQQKERGEGDALAGRLDFALPTSVASVPSAAASFLFLRLKRAIVSVGGLMGVVGGKRSNALGRQPIDSSRARMSRRSPAPHSLCAQLAVQKSRRYFIVFGWVREYNDEGVAAFRATGITTTFCRQARERERGKARKGSGPVVNTRLIPRVALLLLYTQRRVPAGGDLLGRHGLDRQFRQAEPARRRLL